MKPVVLLLGLLLAGCAPDRFVGDVVLTPIQPGAVCGPAAEGLLQVQQHSFVFVPNEGVIALHGTVGTDGQLHGSMTPRDPASTWHFDGKLAGDQVEGVLATPRCRARINLHRG